MRSLRAECGTQLLVSSNSKDGKQNWHARKQYCYRSLKKSLTTLINRVGFLEKCEKWRCRSPSRNCELLCDIYDGKVWQEFQTVDGRPFLCEPNNFALSLGCDWFKPFKHLNDSIGALYLVILNLPREERYKPENMILVGIIPGPKEPKESINMYLYPLIDELLDFWQSEGVMLQCNLSQHPSLIKTRVALICVCCDIPAVRKLCGFAGHRAKHGCSKCMKMFPTGVFENKLDFSGYDRNEWELRQLNEHHLLATQHKHANTKQEKNKLISQYGVRYSVLLRLPYFDIIRMHVIDPMHNLLLGTAKHMMEVWTEREILNNKNFQKIEEMVLDINTSKNVGRLPSKIGSSFAGFSADQWRNWTTFFSPVALKGIIPGVHLNCWLMYVKACSLLCARAIKKSSVRAADLYLQHFCQLFLQIYGAEPCTINMHLHLHLKECIYDYGPVYSWWCFAFERYNGMLGSYYTNKRNIEAQIMNKFLLHQQTLTLNLPPDLADIISGRSMYSMAKGSLMESSVLKLAAIQRLDKFKTVDLPTGTSEHFSIDEPTAKEYMIPPSKRKIITQEDAMDLKKTYTFLYPDKEYLPISYACQEVARTCISGQIYGSQKAKSDKCSVIVAKWPISYENHAESQLQVGIVKFFLKHKALTRINNEVVAEIHIFACVEWMKAHIHSNWFGQSAIVYENTLNSLALRFLPVQRIMYPCAYSKMKIDFGGGLIDNVLIAIPILASHSIS